MNIQIITVPYHMGQKDKAVGLGPTRYLEGGLPGVVQSSGHRTTAVAIDVGHSASIDQVNQSLTGAVAGALAAGAVPLVVAGNCNSCLGTLPALQWPGLGIVWLDAHGDFHSRETSISGNLNGMALALATEKFVAESRTVLLGVRDLDPGERERVSVSRMRVMPAAGWAEAALSKSLPDAERIYLHVDIDVIDAAVNPGVNYRGSGGLSVAQVETALRTICGRYPLAAVAFTNFNAERDLNHKTRDLGLRLIRTICISM